MKKKTMTSLVLVSLTSALFLSAKPADAAPVVGTSTGEAEFSAGTEEWDIVKPGTDTKIEPENPLSPQLNDGGVRLMFVPNFNFGSNTTSVNEANHSVHVNRFKVKGGAADLIGIPQFAQVGDGSGTIGTKWALTAQQDATFKSTDASAHTLTASRIQLHGVTTTNNQRNATVGNMVETVTIPAAGYVNLPVSGDGGALTVLKSKAATGLDSTNNTINSVVFMAGYDETNFVTPEAATEIKDRAKNDSVKLNIPSSDSVQTKAYTANITWTLTTGP